jgi:RNA polymerase sigma-B factor
MSSVPLITEAPASAGPANDISTRARGRAEEQALFRRYQGDGDLGAREELVHRFLPLAERLARRYKRRGDGVEDLVQVASVGLVKAVDRFEPERGTAFSSYAVPTIVGEIKRHFRDQGWSVRLPRAMQERVLKVESAMAELAVNLGRSPTPAEVANVLELSTEEVLEAQDAATAYDAVSLDAQRPGDDEEGPALQHAVGEEDERFELIELGSAIAPTVRAMSDREREILRLRFVEDLTQSEIGERLGISQMHVSRLIRRSLNRLQAVADAA